MTRGAKLSTILLSGSALALILALYSHTTSAPKDEPAMTTTTINSEVSAFVTAQNQGRGDTLPSGVIRSLDYNALAGSVPAGDNAVTGIAGIAVNAATIALPSAQTGNAVIIDGSLSATASTSGPDSYSLVVDTSGNVTLTDNNTGNSQLITGASYLLFDGGATTSDGAYQSLFLIEAGRNATMAAMFNAAFERVPDLAGLEFYIDQYGTFALPDLHSMADFFVRSTEFKTLYPALLAPPDNGGPNDQAFINELYGQILHRTPKATEVQFYVEAIQGTLTTSTGQPIAAADRDTLLEYFTNSPENMADISASNNGWLINPASGVSTFGAPNIKTVVAAEAVTGTINTSTLGPVNSSTNFTITTPSGTVQITGAGAIVNGGAIETLSLIASNIPGETIYLSATITEGFINAPNQTIYSATAGGSTIILPLTDATIIGTIHLSGSSNIVENPGGLTNVITPTKIYGFADGDTYDPFGQTLPGPTATIIAAPPGASVNGASLTFDNTKYEYAIDLGNVGNGSAAEVAAAASGVYQIAHHGPEAIAFFGTTNAGNTVIYAWASYNNPGATVSTASFLGAVELMGVTDSQVHASWFQ